MQTQYKVDSRAAQNGLESCPPRSGKSLKRTARRLFSAKYSSILLRSFNPKALVKTNWNRAHMSGFIGGSKLKCLCSFSFLRHQIKWFHLLHPFSSLMDIVTSSKIRQRTLPRKSSSSIKYGPDRSLSVRKSWNDRWESLTSRKLVPLGSLSSSSSKTGSFRISVTDWRARSTTCSFASPNPAIVAIIAREFTPEGDSFKYKNHP